MGGVTIHSFAGIGIGADSREALLSKVKKNKKAMTRWLRTRVLIIDEGTSSTARLCSVKTALTSRPVSMVDADLFDKLAFIGSQLRKNPVPFGGIQVHIPTCLQCAYPGIELCHTPGRRHRRLLPAAAGHERRRVCEVRV